MTRIEKRRFVGLVEQPRGRVIEDLELINCRFEDCSMMSGASPDDRWRVRHVLATGCRVRSCHIAAPVLEDVTVDGLDTGREPFFVRGALFKHVTIRGTVDRLALHTDVPSMEENENLDAAYESARKSFYEDVDWALDISEADAYELDIRGVPADLLRLDAETQAIVRKDGFDEELWSDLQLPVDYFDAVISIMLAEERDEAVLVVPRRAKDVDRYLEALAILRSEGLAT